MRLLVAVFQAGAAAYVAPVAARLADAGDDVRIVANPVAGRVLMDRGLAFEDCGGVDFDALVADRDAVLASATADPREADLIAAGGDIPTLQAVDGAYNYAYRFPDGVVWPSRILVLNDRAADEAVAEGLPRDRLAAVGHPAWEAVERLPEGDADTVLFVDQPIETLVGEKAGFTERACFEILETALAQMPGTRKRAIVCLHPERAGENPYPVEVVEAGEGLRRAGCVVGMYSSLMVDGFLAGRPVVSVQPTDGEANNDMLSRWGMIALARDVDGLANALVAVGDERGDRTNPFSGSTDRVVSVLRDLVEAA